MANYDMTREAWMLTQQRFQEAAAGSWRWPLLDLACYDRRASLWEQERLALAELSEYVEQERWREAHTLIRAATLAPTGLTRCVVPLCDVLDLVGAAKSKRHLTLRLLLLEVHRRQLPFWAWQPPDWLEILRADTGILSRMRHAVRDCWPYLAAVSYLLADVTDFRPHWVYIVTVATSLFGKTSLERAASRIEKAFPQADAPQIARRHRLLCQLFLLNHSPLLDDLRYECLSQLYNKERSLEWKRELVRLSHVLAVVARVECVLPSGLSAEWVQWCRRWQERSTLEDKVRQEYYVYLLRIGQWLRESDPDVHSPQQWSDRHTRAFVQALEQSGAGLWRSRGRPVELGECERVSRDLSAGTKNTYMLVLHTFFSDCWRWRWFQVEFQPGSLPWAREEGASPPPSLQLDG